MVQWGSWESSRRVLVVVGIVLCLAALVGLPAGRAFASPIYVSAVGSDTAGNGSLAKPYASVQRAVNAARPGDDVRVGAGTFTGNIVMKDSVSLYGAGSDKTILSGTGSGSVITAKSIGAATTISGFTITGGTGTPRSVYGLGPWLSGGGIYCYLSALTITDSSISGNTAQHGAGIYCFGGCNGCAVFTNDTISDNTGADSESCAGAFIDGSNPSFINDTFSGNTCPRGGIGCIVNTPILCTPDISNCILWDQCWELNGCAATYSDDDDYSPGVGNIDLPPSFVGTATGDYHLNGDSPCIGAGTSAGAPATDKDGAPRPKLGGCTMGAYEPHVPHQLHYVAGSGGVISGTTSQTVDFGGLGTAVTAVPNPGYHFTGWSDGVMIPTRRDGEFTVNVTANFSSTYQLTYTAGAHGTISGDTSQAVAANGDATTVTAVPDPGYHFVGWSDGVLSATRQETNVTSDLWATANFDLPIAGLGGSLVTELNSTDGYKEYLASSGHLVVYDVERGGDPGTVPELLGVYDLSNGSESIVATNARWPDVYGNTITYVDIGDAGQENVLCKLDWLSRSTTVVKTTRDTCIQPVLDGDIVVYSGWTSGIHGVNLATGRSFTVTTSSKAWEPDVKNGWVVYALQMPSEHGVVRGDIMAYRISTGKTYTLSSDPHDKWGPKISSNGIVAWDDERNSGSQGPEHTQTDVYGCSVYNRTNFPIATGPGAQGVVSINGNLVSYTDSNASAGYGAMGFDLLSGVHFGMVPSSYYTPSTEWAGLADGGVVFTSNRWVDGNEVSDLYTANPTQIDVTDAYDPYTNAASASRAAFPDGCDAVVIASGQSWTDDLAAASLDSTDCPLLLTEPTTLPKVTADELRRLGATSATILGGTDAISAGVQAQIQAILQQNFAAKPLATASFDLSSSSRVHRISGDRYAVADAIASQVASRSAWDGTVIVASGVNFSDALAASPLAAARGIPIILSSAKGLGSGALALLRSIHAVRALVVGDTKRVPASVDTQLRAIVGAGDVIRFAGKDSFTSAAQLAAYAVSTYGLSWDGVGLGSSASFADLLVGGLSKGRSGSVLLLTNGSILSTSASAALKAHHVSIRAASVLGGLTCVTKKVRGQIRLVLH